MPSAVTVIIPTYNRAHLVARAITSALQQLRVGDRIIVVDDGSTDSTGAVLRPLLESIDYIRTKNGGAGAARNVGVREARTPLIAFLDSDDEWLPGKLELQRSLMDARPDVLFCFSDFAEFSGGKIVRFYLNQWHASAPKWEEMLGPSLPYSSIANLPNGFQDFPVHIGDLFSHMVRSNYVLTDTVVVRREEAGEALFFDEDLRYWEDYVCFTRLSQCGRAAFLKIETAVQYDHEARLSRAPELVYLNATIAALNRRWSLDPSHVDIHREQYEEIRDQIHRRKAAALLALGRTKEARSELRSLRSVPLRYKMVYTLPGFLARSLLSILKLARRLRTT